MELIAKVSKGTLMDQIYIPKRRSGYGIGSYVRIIPLEKNRTSKNLIFNNVSYIEPIKIDIIYKIIGLIDKNSDDYDNIIITGSFIEKGFHFNDIDILIVSDNNIPHNAIQASIKTEIGITSHIISLNKKSLTESLSYDPAFQLMIDKCISKKRFIFKVTPKINYQFLDLKLLESNVIFDEGDELDIEEKYDIVRNVVSIFLFIKHKKITNNELEQEIFRIFHVPSELIKRNTINQKIFIKKFRNLYNKTFDLIMRGISGGKKQKKNNKHIHR